MSEVKHSPLPWGIWQGHLSVYSQITENKRSFIRSREMVCECDDLDRGKKVAAANAEYIVQACNAYPSLTAELTEAKRRIGELEAGLGRTITALAHDKGFRDRMVKAGGVDYCEALSVEADLRIRREIWAMNEIKDAALDAARALLSNEKGGE